MVVVDHIQTTETPFDLRHESIKSMYVATVEAV